MTGYVATMDSEKFSWLAFGETSAEALAALDRGFLKHLDQADSAWLGDEAPSVYYDAQTYSVDYGWCYRDYDAIIHNRAPRPLPSVEDLVAGILKLIEQDFGPVGMTLFRSFSQLHDVVDANEYVLQALQEFGIDCPDFGSETETNLVNAATDEVTAVLADGAHPRTTITNKEAP